ncbi:pol polyprotein, partial [Pseudoloma neurophilia]
LTVSDSPQNSRLVPVMKPDGSPRMCLDYRPLNSVCQKDNYQMQNVDVILDKLAGAKFFSILDATSGYYKISLDPESRKKTAITWQRKRYEFTRMPFGLINARHPFKGL